MLAAIRDLPRQCQTAWEEAQRLEFPPDYREVDKVVVLGMGGSAIAGEPTASSPRYWPQPWSVLAYHLAALLAPSSGRRPTVLWGTRANQLVSVKNCLHRFRKLLTGNRCGSWKIVRDLIDFYAACQIVCLTIIVNT